MDANDIIYTLAALAVVFILFLVWQARRQIKERRQEADKEIQEKISSYKERTTETVCFCASDNQYRILYYLLFTSYVSKIVYDRHSLIESDEVIDLESNFRIAYNRLMEVDIVVNADHHREVFRHLKRQNLVVQAKPPSDQ
ncbi:hypothetical protein [Vibrio phage BONAISHI]|nr:hypothetical protein [Vibrio phage BONAISHI]